MFIGRRADGSIYGSWTVRQPNDADHPNVEEVADNHPDLVAYQARTLPANSANALLSRQRTEALDALDAVIKTLPSAQQAPFKLIQQLLKE